MIQANELLEWQGKVENAYWQSLDAQKECFAYHGLEFDIEGAKRLAQGRKVYQIEPNADWNLEAKIDHDHVESVDLTKPIIFATLIDENGAPGVILIDGHHRVEKALQCGVEKLPAVTIPVHEVNQIVTEV